MINTLNTKIFTLQGIKNIPVQQKNNEVYRDFHLKKRKVMAYRLIFIALGVIFASCGCYMFLKTPNWNYSLIFGMGWAMKMLLTLISFSFSFASLWAGCHLRTESELLNSYKQRYTQKLTQIFQRKRFPLSLQPTESSSEKTLHNHYLETLDELHHICNRTHHKLDFINHVTGKSHSERLREKLDALATLKLRLEGMVHSFNLSN